MASVLNKTNIHKDDDEDDDIEALRLAALMTLRKKPAVQPASSSTVTFKPHIGNPNLIAIIPEGAEPVTHQSQGFFRRHPHPHPHHGRLGPHQQYRGITPSSHTTLKVLPQVPLLQNKTSPGLEKKVDSVNQEKEEVSTKFSRFEDTESESEDESDNEEKESDESSDESDDVLALQDEDDSLEALMAQMEHEIESGIDLEPNKKEKKKSKTSKSREKEPKGKLDEKCSPTLEKCSPTLEKTKAETKTAIVEPTLKDTSSKQEGVKAVMQERPKSPVKIHPIKINSSSGKITTELTKRPSPVQKQVDPPVQMSSQSLSNQRSLTPPPKSPQRGISPSTRTVRRSRSPRNASRSRSRSPVVRTTSPLRRKSPRRLTPDRRSPVKRSPDRYYSGKRSTSPYYKPREREYLKRSRSPVRRKSLSPRRTFREPSPRYYQRRSRSPWSPGYRHSPESPSRYRSPVHRRSLSPRKKYSRPGYSSHSPTYRGSPKRRTPSLSPRRSKSPARKREYSPQRRRPSPRRDFSYRRNSLSPKRKPSPPPKKYSPQRSPRRIQRSPSPRRDISPRRRISPLATKESRSKAEQRSRTPSLSLSPSPPRESKGQSRRYKSPLRPRREAADLSNRISRQRRPHSPEKTVSVDMKEKRNLASKPWERERENKPWERKIDERRKERGDRIDRETRKDKEINKSDKEKLEEQKEERNLRVTDNPLFEARRKKFESTALVEPASKKIRLISKKTSPVDKKPSLKDKPEVPKEEKKIVEHSVQTEDDLFSGQEEVDEIDNFLNEDQEDVLDLSAEVWDSDDDILPKVTKAVTRKPAKKVKSTKKQSSGHEKSSSKEKRENRKAAAAAPSSPPQKRTAPSKSRSPSPELKTGANLEQEERKDRDDSDLRAELSRRREERLTKAGSLHEKLPRRLLQNAFESALGKKKTKKEDKPKKSEKETKKRDKDNTPPAHKEKSDGRRVLVLKRPAPVKMQSAHINVTFPSRNGESESESSYTSSSSEEEEERYAAAAPKRKLPVYMRLGTAQHKHVGARKVKLHSRRSQV